MTGKEAKKRKLIVIKIGSGCLNIDEEKTIAFHDIAEEVLWLRKAGYDAVFVVSGAVKYGRLALHGLGEEKKEVNVPAVYQKYAGVGQSWLMGFYNSIFYRRGIKTSEYLLTYKNLSSPEEAECIRAAIEIDLENGIAPLINYNDKLDWKTPHKGEILKDNDRFAAEIAKILKSPTLIIRTGDVGGLMENGKLVPVVYGDEIKKYKPLCTGAGSGTLGGFKTKLEAGEIMLSFGGICVIANIRLSLLEVLRDIISKNKSPAFTLIKSRRDKTTGGFAG